MERSATADGSALAQAIAPLVADPGRSAVFCDIDGTLAPIVERSHDALVPEAQRRVLGSLASRYAMVGCISGRPATEARRLVGVGNLVYIGNHGYELILPGRPHADLHSDVAPHADRSAEFVASLDPRLLRSVKLRVEEKGPITSLHWRGVPDEEAAERRAREISEQAEEAGLAPHWGRKVLELRPRVEITKGTALAAVLSGSEVRRVLYGGDDRTDLDVFRTLELLRDERRLETIVRIGVSSAEAPDAILRQADAVVEGPAGFLAALEALS